MAVPLSQSPISPVSLFFVGLGLGDNIIVASSCEVDDLEFGGGVGVGGFDSQGYCDY